MEFSHDKHSYLLSTPNIARQRQLQIRRMADCRGRTSNLGLLDTRVALMILTHPTAIIIRQSTTWSRTASSRDRRHSRRGCTGRDRCHHRRGRLHWRRIAGLRSQHAWPRCHGDQRVEWLQLLVSGVWRRPRYSVGGFNWHHWRRFEVVACIFMHGRGVVLAPTAAVSSHVSPLSTAVLGLMRLMRVGVHAGFYVDEFFMWQEVPDAEPDLSTTVLAN